MSTLSHEATGRAIQAVATERARQESYCAERRVTQPEFRSCADVNLDPYRKLAVLTEEVGEVAEALNEMAIGGFTSRSEGLRHLRAELVQVAAVAVAWIEATDVKIANRERLDALFAEAA